MCWSKDFVEIHWKVTFVNNTLLELEKITYSSMTFVIPTLFETKVFKPIATSNVKDENIKFESDRTSSMSEKIKTKQSLLSSKFLSSHQIPSYHTKTISKLNEYKNKYIEKFTTS